MASDDYRQHIKSSVKVPAGHTYTVLRPVTQESQPLPIRPRHHSDEPDESPESLD